MVRCELDEQRAYLAINVGDDLAQSCFVLSAGVGDGPVGVRAPVNHHWFSSIAPTALGAGDKTTHNVFGDIGALSGAHGDLRTGLPWQALFASDPGTRPDASCLPRHVPARLAGYETADVHAAVISHLHQDHIGGLAELAGAKLLVSKLEWEALNKARPEARGYLTSHIDLPGLTWQQVEPEPLADATIAPFTHGHDLFGDGSLVLLPAPGHTPGSQSMLVRRPGLAPLLLVGDLTYDMDLLTAGSIPGVGSRRQLRSATGMVNALRATHPDLVILAAHDPHAASRLDQAFWNGGAHQTG